MKGIEPITREERRALAELGERATPRPWTRAGRDILGGSWFVAEVFEPDNDERANAKLIVAVVNAVAGYEAALVELEVERDRLLARQQELLTVIRNLSMSSISESDADELRGQLAALIAEVGTLRARLKNQ